MRAPVDGETILIRSVTRKVVLPPLRAEVIEYQLHPLRCAHCDRLTEAGWARGPWRGTPSVPACKPGSACWPGAYRLSKRNIRALLSDAFGLEVSLGTVSRLEREVAAALAGAVEEARAFVRRQGLVNVDETGWRQAPRQGLVVDRGDGRRHRVRHSPQPGTRRGR